MSVLRSKAEQRYAELNKRESEIKSTVETAARQRLEKSAKLRQLRLAKEAEDAARQLAEKNIKAAGKGALKKPRTPRGRSGR